MHKLLTKWNMQKKHFSWKIVVTTVSRSANGLWARRASKIFGLLSSIWVFIADTGSFWSLKSD